MDSKMNQEDADFALAWQLQATFDEDAMCRDSSSKSTEKKAFSGSLNKNASTSHCSIVDESWEVTDPNPDIHGLFLQFNDAYFWGKLDGIEVRWSPRMTLCAGLCCYEGRGGLCSIRLSQPLLKFRPRKDLVQTLLHEMIHAFLFVTCNNRDHDAHGPEFLKHMHRINKETGAKITVYHNFHDEVNEHRKHWWRCNGPCRKQPPFYGYVKRAMNRAPSPLDLWWSRHKSKCNGEFIKVKEPESKKTTGKGSQVKRSHSLPGFKKKVGSKSMDIRGFISPTSTSKVLNKSDHPSNLSVGSVGVQKTPVVSTLSTIKSSTSADIHTCEEHGNENVNPSFTMSRPFIPFSGKGYSLNSSVEPLQTTEPHCSSLPNIPSREQESSEKSRSSKFRTFIPFSGKGYSLNSDALPSEAKKTSGTFVKQIIGKNSTVSSTPQNPAIPVKNTWKTSPHNKPNKGYTFKTLTGTTIASRGGVSRTIVLPRNTSAVKGTKNIGGRLNKSNKHKSSASTREENRTVPRISPWSSAATSTSSNVSKSGDTKGNLNFFSRKSASFINTGNKIGKPMGRASLPGLKRKRVEVPENSPHLRKSLKEIFSSDSEEEKDIAVGGNGRKMTNESRTASAVISNLGSLSTPSDGASVRDHGNDILVTCPVCGSKVLEATINSHLDECLS